MNGKKATRAQRKILVRAGLDTYVWLVQKDAPTFLQLLNKETGEVKTIQK